MRCYGGGYTAQSAVPDKNAWQPKRPPQVTLHTHAYRGFARFCGYVCKHDGWNVMIAHLQTVMGCHVVILPPSVISPTRMPCSLCGRHEPRCTQVKPSSVLRFAGTLQGRGLDFIAVHSHAVVSPYGGLFAARSTVPEVYAWQTQRPPQVTLHARTTQHCIYLCTRVVHARRAPITGCTTKEKLPHFSLHCPVGGSAGQQSGARLTMTQIANCTGTGRNGAQAGCALQLGPSTHGRSGYPLLFS